MSNIHDAFMLCGGGFFHASCGGLDHSRLGCKHRSDVLCCFAEACCSTSDPQYSQHCASDRIMFPCCIVGVMKPQCRMSSATNVLCFWEACSIPLTDEYLSKPTWAVFGFQCSPQEGFALSPPHSQVINRPNITKT